jgi:hypothetical protein
MISQGSGNKAPDQPIFRVCGQRVFAQRHQGVRFRGGADPVYIYQTRPVWTRTHDVEYWTPSGN